MWLYFLNNAFIHRCFFNHHIINGFIKIFLFQPQTAACISLGIKIHQHNMLSCFSQTGGKINGCSSLTYSTLLIGYCYDSSHMYKFLSRKNKPFFDYFYDYNTSPILFLRKIRRKGEFSCFIQKNVSRETFLRQKIGHPNPVLS